MNINDFDRLYRRVKTGLVTTGDTLRISLNPVGAKTLRVLTHVTVENKTATRTKSRLGINHGGRDHYLDEIMAPVKDELIVSRSDILLGEGDYFFVELWEAQVTDDVILTCVGWEQSLR